VKKQMTKVTYICRSPTTKGSYLLYYLLLLSVVFLIAFWEFRNKGSSKTREKKAFPKKVHLGLKICGVFFSVFFIFSLGCFGRFFMAFFGRFVTRGDHKRDKKITGNFPQPPKKKYSCLLTSLPTATAHGAP
jgi:hypothetical protein